MAQKRRKNSKIVSFLCPISLLAEIDQATKEQQQRTLRAPLSGRSEFIIRALRRDLDHRRRSRKTKGDNRVPETQVAAAQGEEPTLCPLPSSTSNERWAEILGVSPERTGGDFVGD